MAEPVLKRRRTEPASDPAAVDAPEERDVPFEHSRFFLAAALGDLDAAIAAHTPAELERADALGRTALMAAAGRGHLDVVRWLVAARGADAARGTTRAATRSCTRPRTATPTSRATSRTRAAATSPRATRPARRRSRSPRAGHLLCVKVLAARGAGHGSVLSSRRGALCPEHVRARGSSRARPLVAAPVPRRHHAARGGCRCCARARTLTTTATAATTRRARRRRARSRACPSLQTAAIVRRAAAPWGRANHDMFPRGARAAPRSCS